MIVRMKSVHLPAIAALTAVSLLTLSVRAHHPPQAAPAGDRPRLVVFLIVDQFRADYAAMYGDQWTKGLRRLLDHGAVMTNSAYPYAATLTCAGHATISTGAFPSVHGLSGNDFYDRALRRLVRCTTDPFVRSVTFAGGVGTEHYSARNIFVPTFTDELRRQSRIPPRVVAIAQKPRSSVTLAGRGSPETVAVWEEDDGTWATSSAYTSTPWPDVDEFVRSRPMKADYGTVWTPLLPPDRYKGVDAGAGEGRPAPWTQTFPHNISSTKGVPDNEFVSAWERSPLNDAFLTDLAIHLLKSRKLGTGDSTDVLTLSLPNLDHIGHEYGPRSHEVQDILLRVDANIGRLLDALDEQAPGRYVFGLSSDHGVMHVPEQLKADGLDAGRVSTTAIQKAVNTAVAREIGFENAVAAVWEQQIALVPGVFDALRKSRNGLTPIKNAIRSVPGILTAFSSDDVLAGDKSKDPLIHAWRLSQVLGRTGDFLFVMKPNWIARSTSGTTHGTMRDYDQRVPLILFGARVKPGRYDAASTPADLAPTFASLVGIAMPQARGRALAEALVR